MPPRLIATATACLPMTALGRTSRALPAEPDARAVAVIGGNTHAGNLTHGPASNKDLLYPEAQ